MLRPPRFWRTLRAKAVLLLSVIALLTVGATTALHTVFESRHIYDEAIKVNLAEAQGAAIQVVEIVEDVEYGLELVAAFIEWDWERSGGDPVRLNHLLESIPHDRRLTAVILFDAGRTQQATSSVDKSLNGRTLDEPHLRRVLDEGQAQVGNARRGALTGLPVVPIAVPVRGRSGSVEGVLQGTMSLVPIADQLAHVKANRPGHVSIVAPGSLILVHPEARRVLTVGSGTNRIVQEGLAGRTAFGETPTSSGDSVFSAAVPIPSLGWVAQAQTPVDAARVALYESQRRALLVGGLALLLAVLLGVLAATRVDRPVRQMQAVAAQIAQGTYRAGSLRIRSGDELEELAESIDSMAAEIAASHQAIKESESRLALALTSSRQGLWDWDLIRDEAYLSPVYWQLLGYEEGEVRADGAFFQSIVHPDDAADVFRAMGEHLQGKSEQSISEYRMRTRSGDYRWMRGLGAVMARAEDGAPLRMVGVVMDISEERRADEVRHAAIELDGQLTGIRLAGRELAHVLNNALTLPTALVELLLDHPDTSPQTRELAQQAAVDLRRAVDCIAQLQRVVRVETRETVVGTVLDLERSSVASESGRGVAPRSTESQ